MLLFPKFSVINICLDLIFIETSNKKLPNATSTAGINSRYFIHLICHEITMEQLSPGHETACLSEASENIKVYLIPPQLLQ